MQRARRPLVIAAGLTLAGLLVSLQFFWILHSPAYLEKTAARTGIDAQLAAVLPEYAAQKMPDPETTKKVFAANVTPATVHTTLQALYVSVSDAYNGKYTTVEFSLDPILQPIEASGYQIPPGTIFATRTVQVGNLASILHASRRTMIPTLLLFAGLTTLVVLLALKKNLMRSLAGMCLVAAIALAGLFAMSLAISPLTESLLTSSQLDASIRTILQSATTALAKDAGRYYLWSAAVLLIIALLLSLGEMVIHTVRRPHRKHVPIDKADPTELKRL